MTITMKVQQDNARGVKDRRYYGKRAVTACRSLLAICGDIIFSYEKKESITISVAG